MNPLSTGSEPGPAHPPMKPYQRMLCVCCWLNDFALFTLVFAVGRHLADGNAGLLKMGVMGAGFFGALGVSGLVFGRLSDRFGRRRVLTAGSLFLIITLVGNALTIADGEVLYTWYWLSGLAVGAVYPPAYSWLSETDDAKPEARRIGRTIIWFCLSWNLGIISGQIAGGWLYPFAVVAPVYLGIVLAVINFVLWQIAASMRRGNGAPARAPAVSRTEDQLLSRQFVKLAWLANLGGAFSMTMIFHLFPQVAVELGVPPGKHGLIVGITRFITICTYLLMWRFSFWHLRFATALGSQLLAVAGMITIALAAKPIWLVAGLVGLAQLTGYNYFASLYYATHGSTDEQRGTASGLHEATLAIGFAAGSAIGGWVGHHTTSRAPFVLGATVIAGLAIIQCAIYWFRVRPVAAGVTEIP